MENFFMSIDFIGQEIYFNINDSKKFKTPLGGIFTIILTCTFIFAAFFFGRDLYEKNNPTFLVQNLRLGLNPRWNLTNENFFFGIRVEDENFTTIEDPRYFEIVHTYIHYQKNANNKFVIFKKENYFMKNKCNDTHMKGHLNMIKSGGIQENSQDFSNFFCPDINHLIGGDFTDNFYGALSFSVKLCDSSTEKRLNLTCASQKEREDKYKNKFFVGKVTHNHILDTTDYAHPITQTFDYTVQKLELDFKKQNSISLSINVLKTDSNIIGIGYIDQTFLQIESEKPDFTTIDSTGVVSENHILMSRNTNNHMRSYIKLQQVIAITGGFTSLIMKILMIIYSFYVNSIYYQFIFNNMIEIENEKQDQKVELLNGEKQEKTGYIPQTTTSNSLRQQQTLYIPQAAASGSDGASGGGYNLSNIKLDKKKILSNSITKRESKFKLTFCQGLLDSFSVNKKNTKQYTYNEESIRCLIKTEVCKKFNILNYFKLFDQFDIVKKCIMNDYQEYMLLNKRKFNFSDLINENTSKIDKKELNEYILDKNRNNSFTNIDNLLISYLNPLIKTALELPKFSETV